VCAWNPHLGNYADKTNELYFIDKNTMQLATLPVSNPMVLTYSSSTNPTGSHANSLTYVPSENTIYVNSMNKTSCYAVNLNTFTVSTKTLPVGATAFAFDPITQQWCYVSVSGSNYTIRIYASNNSTLLKTLTIPFKNAQQGCMFYNGLIYLVKSELSEDSEYTDNVFFVRKQSILVFDTAGNLLKSWWFDSHGKGYIELEDIDILDEGKIVIGLNFNGSWGMLYEMQIMPENNSPNKTENDLFDLIQLDQHTDFMTSVSGVNLNDLTYDGRYYVASNSSNTNLPTGITSGWIDVYVYKDANSTIVKQIMHSSDSAVMAIRRCENIYATTPVWSPWDVVNNVTALKVLACGDSICKGARNNEKGFIGDIGCDYKNIGVIGARLSGTASSSIPSTFVSDSGYNPDVIIANGGINDYDNDATLGDIPTAPATTDSEASALNRNTVMGGTGYLFYQMVKKYPNAQRFFLITHKTYADRGNAKDGYYPTRQNGAGYTQEELHDALVAICNVYGVKVIDVYKDSMINSAFTQYRSPVTWSSDHATANQYLCDKDGIHPTGLGYIEGYVPLIKQALGLGTLK
jgi:lysophospholipase L1-like esterase